MIVHVVYRSRAVQPLAPADLRQMGEAGRSRNRREGLTGLILYDGPAYSTGWKGRQTTCIA